jgi:hypothetical protein
VKIVFSLTLLSVAAGGFVGTACAQSVPGDSTVQAQWFTGTLETPSPALSKAGLVAVEPYVIYQINTGSYDTKGKHQAVADDIRRTDSVTLIKYGISNRLTFQALPSFAHVSNAQASVTGVDDLPVELQYRFNDENNETGLPSVTASIGVSLPIGNYQRLSADLDGLGSGAYTLTEQILLQSLFDTPHHHPVRLRLYGTVLEPLRDVALHGQSVYGTGQGFAGHAAPGLAGNFGFGGGYSLTQRWVLALDLIQKFAHGSRIEGVEALGNAVNIQQFGNARTGIAPAVEYNFSSHVGLIAGVALSIFGRNVPSYYAPQIALTASF